MTKKRRVLSLTGVLLLIAVGFFAMNLWNEGASDKPVEIDWYLLSKLDYKTGDAPRELKRLHNKMVKMPGFVVPLTDNYSVLNEFLLVPNAQACIHVPPPPPNLIVHVHLKSTLPMRQVHNPSWVTGILKIETSTSIHGQSSFKMVDAEMEKYVPPRRRR
ncbi:MAG: DUF3299 domain-containing protein [Bdellovibrionaceae bacterium]|nr:DUF3299 domain-containing protein [Pseudobdellovibrionaceae bacterium]